MSTKNTLGASILLVLFGAFATAYIENWFGLGPHFLEFKRDVRAPFIASTDDLSQHLAITYRKKPLQALSAVDVDIFNHAGKDAQNIELHFNLKPIINASQNFKLLEVYMIGPKVLGDVGIERLPKYESEKRVVFKVTNLKQTTDKREYLYTVRFLFEGDSVAEIIPVTPNANWEFKDHVNLRANLELLWTIVVTLVLSAFIAWLGYLKTEKSRYNFADDLRRHLLANSATTERSRAQVDQIIESYLDLSQPRSGWYWKEKMSIRAWLRKKLETSE